MGLESWTPSWHEEAACIGVDPQLFFSSERQLIERRTALAICRGCSVRMICLKDAIDKDDQFIRGGTTYEQRRIMSLFMIALAPIQSSLDDLPHNEPSLVSHTVQVEIHTYHSDTPEQHQSSPIPPFELDQSVLGVSGIRPLLEVLHSQVEHEIELSPLDFTGCLVVSACS